jgi:GDPmannose 4,6-dehydratase
LQHPIPDDYIFATGKLHSVEDILQRSFSAVNLDWRNHVETDPNLLRLTEPLQLVGDASKAKSVLGWSPEVTFDELIREMTMAELESI